MMPSEQGQTLTGISDLDDLLAVSPQAEAENAWSPADAEMSPDLEKLLAVSPGAAIAPTSEDQMSAATSGAVSGVIEGGTFGAGFTAGFAATPPILPGVGPLAKPLGGLVGGIVTSGYLSDPIKNWLQEKGLLDYTSPSEVPEQTRPYYYGANVASSSIAGGGILTAGASAASAIPKAGGRVKDAVGSWLNNIFKTAQTSPGKVMGTEVSSAISAGMGSAALSSKYPDSEAMAMLGGITAGAVNPSLLLYNGSAALIRKVTGLKLAHSTLRGASGLTPAQEDASRWMRQLYKEAGETPDIRRLVALANDAGFLGDKVTLGQKTGDKAILALENALKKNSLKFRLETSESFDATLKFMNAQIDDLLAQGDPQSLRMAAAAQVELITSQLKSLSAMADIAARDTIEKMVLAGTRDKAELGKAAYKAADDVRAAARQVESLLWDQVNLQLKIPSDLLQDSELLSLHKGILQEVYKEFKIPAPIKPYIARLAKAANVDIAETTVDARVKHPAGFWITPSKTGVQESDWYTKDLVGFRKDMLSAASEARNAGRSAEAKLFGDYAEAARKDLDKFMSSMGDSSHKTASAFSREFNDTFTRTFAGRMRDTNRFGNAIPPELLLERAFAGKEQAARLRLEELDEATRFLSKIHRKTSPDDVVGAAVRKVIGDVPVDTQFTLMHRTQEQALRIMAQEAIDPRTGLISEAKLAGFKHKYPDLIARFPGLGDAIDDAMSSEQYRATMQKILASPEGTEVPRSINRQYNMAVKLTGDEDSSRVVDTVLKGSSPAKGLKELAHIAKAGTTPGQDVVSSLRRSVYDSVKAPGEDGPMLFAKRLRDPISPGNPSLLDSMKAEGILSQDQYNLAEKFLKEIDRFYSGKSVIGTAKLPGDENTPFSFIQRALVRIVALHGASATNVNQAGAGSLAASSAVANVADKLVNMLPSGRVIDALIQGMNDPKLGALMLKNIDTLSEREAFVWASRVHGYLFGAGIIPMTQGADE